MLQSRKPVPNLDQQSTKALNLTVLQRADAFVEEILLTATHVALYAFSVEINQWSRKEVEGSLFVVLRNTQPRFQFIVMNRRNADNLVEDLLGDFEYEVHMPYLLYCNASQEINGIWFYDSHECEAVANLFNRILNAYSKVQPKLKPASSKSEFEEVEAMPDLSAAPPTTDVPNDNFLKFFNVHTHTAATEDGNTTIAGQAPLVSTAIPVLNNIQTTLSSTRPTPILPTSSIPLIVPKGSHESSIGNDNLTTKLVKPSFFSAAPSSISVKPPISSSVMGVLPVYPRVAVQQPRTTPLSFPPATLFASLTPAPNYGHVHITRDHIGDALLRLAQNDNFIDMVYRAMFNAHYQYP
ncbi:mRNA-decapping enzyme-like protein isoform X1 [Zingiber officinale]|uniref:mRNA-decapping enzyme-like protein isoform X1 n=1 Tax=Zingiber officinale TaxID=94328 RepID=UPI001C4D4225|nr:mRNA-decapping enzyme-like protein isoform X1 [Zingiber officinale]